MPDPTFVDNLTGSRGPFVLLAGAGISLWHPSSLPTWTEFNTALLDEATARALRALPARSPLRSAIGDLTVADIGSKAFSNALVDILAGETYFEVVGALDASQPNPVHRGIARLVARGVIAAIVTTNFDTLIERALAEEGLATDVYSRTWDYSRPRGAGCAVFKIHGSATPGSTLIDTVGQKLRGLPPFVRARLQEVFAQHPVLVLGYSGGDLEFGADYLALRCVPRGKQGLWWVVRPEDRDRIEAPARTVVSEHGQFVVMSQVDVLEALGAGTLQVEWNVETRAARLQQLRTSARALFARHGSLNTLAFCMRLLSAAGQTRTAALIWTDVAEEIDRRKRQTVPALGPAMRALAAEGHRLFGVEAQEAWACRQLKDIDRRRTGRPRQRHDDETALLRDVRSEALACLALGDSLVRRGRYEEAGLAMQRAMEGCEYIGDITLLPGVYRLYGWRDVVRFGAWLSSHRPLGDTSAAEVAELAQLEDRGLSYLTAAEAASLVGGQVDAIESAWIRADLLVDMGEYDAALLCLERLTERMGLGLHRETRVRMEALLGEIDVRQGRASDGMSRWNACLAELAHGNPMLDAYVKHVIIGRIGFAPEFRDAVLMHCDDILARMARGELPADGRSDLIGPREYFETVRTNLAALGSARLDPGFIQNLDWPTTRDEYLRWPAHFVRQELIQREFEGDVSGVLDDLDLLVACQYQALSGMRALDAATAHVRRARRDGNDDQRFAAEVNLAAIRHWLGDTDAVAWFASALQEPRGQSQEARSGLERRLPHALWRSTGLGAADATSRNIALDLDDALAMKWVRPPTGADRERDAVRRFAESDFVTGRILALEAAALFRDEGDPGGLVRALDLLRSAGARDHRSEESPLGLCK